MSRFFGARGSPAGLDEEVELSVQDELCKFHEEVLSRGAEAALPHNLSDGWLRRLKYCIEERDRPSVAIMAVLAIAASKPGLSTSDGGSISKEELVIYIDRYHAELAIEEIYRNTGVFLDRSTLGTILTNRMVVL